MLPWHRHLRFVSYQHPEVCVVCVLRFLAKKSIAGEKKVVLSWDKFLTIDWETLVFFDLDILVIVIHKKIFSAQKHKQGNFRYGRN